MNKNSLKIFLLFLSAVYILSFLEVCECEREQNCRNECHHYVITSNTFTSIKIITDSSSGFSKIIFNYGIDKQLLVHSQLYTNIIFSPAGYLPQKIYITNSVFLI